MSKGARVAFWMLVVVLLYCPLARADAAQGQGSLQKDLARMVAYEEAKDIPDDLTKSVVHAIEQAPEAALTVIIPLATAPKVSEKDLAIYIWALGLTKQPQAAAIITRITDGTQSEWVKMNTCRALVDIQDRQAGAYIVKQLATIKDEETRYTLIDLLAQIQYQEALPFMKGVLTEDPEKFYWKSIFVFGKMGDAGVPYLLGMLKDPDRKVRVNTIMLLGRWLKPPEAVPPLREAFWKEKEAEIRIMILGSLEGCDSNPDSVLSFSQKVITQEKDAEITKFARETIAQMPEMRKIMKAYQEKKRLDPVVFQREYKALYDSRGHEGDYEKLASASSSSDEGRLKTLRERILQRNSDEAFYDYQKINQIIQFNRVLKTSAPPASPR